MDGNINSTFIKNTFISGYRGKAEPVEERSKYIILNT